MRELRRCNRKHEETTRSDGSQGSPFKATQRCDLVRDRTCGRALVERIHAETTEKGKIETIRRVFHVPRSIPMQSDAILISVSARGGKELLGTARSLRTREF